MNYRPGMKDRDGNMMVNLKHLGGGMIIAGLVMGFLGNSSPLPLHREQCLILLIGGFVLMVINKVKGGD